jgi:mannose-6-phosphate isomerase-like protein (cupin superfamily)
MALRVNRADVLVEVGVTQDTWRFVRRDGPTGVGVGIASFKQVASGAENDESGEVHDVPEVHYVLSGEGVLIEDGERIALRADDAVVTPAGARHAFFSTSRAPLVTLYVAISPTAASRR